MKNPPPMINWFRFKVICKSEEQYYHGTEEGIKNYPDFVVVSKVPLKKTYV